MACCLAVGFASSVWFKVDSTCRSAITLEKTTLVLSKWYLGYSLPFVMSMFKEFFRCRGMVGKPVEVEGFFEPVTRFKVGGLQVLTGGLLTVDISVIGMELLGFELFLGLCFFVVV